MTRGVALAGSAENPSIELGADLFFVAGEESIRAASLSAESLSARLSVWRSFCLRLAESGDSHLTARPAALARLALSHRSGPRPKEHALRVLSMAADAFEAMMASGVCPRGDNPAILARSRLDYIPANDPSSFPSPADRVLLAAHPSSGSGGDSLRARDLAIFSLCLGAGAPPTAVSVSTVSCIRTAVESGSIVLRVPSPSAKRPLEWMADLLPFARPALSEWLEFNHADGPAFPGRHGAPLSRAQVFRVAASEITRAIGAGPLFKACPQTLRNCHFSFLADSGMSPEEISRRMGWTLGDQEQHRRLSLAWKAAQGRS